MIMARTGSGFCLLSLISLVVGWGIGGCIGFGTFGFDIHHRFSDPVKGFLGFDAPEKGSLDYYKALVHGDRLIRGRHLASDDQTSSPLTFYDGNATYRLAAFGFLHYANITVGSPSSSYLVALDTGSDLFWLPCDCTSCVQGIKFTDGEILKFSIYSPNTSSTSSEVSCNSTLCEQRRRQCPSETSTCPYQVVYLSNGTSSTGYLVEDVLHLKSDDDQLKDVDARITFGCGKVQTGTFLDGAAPNGLIGLGIEDISVPSILAKEGHTSNSFSMCFGSDGLGRIRFGDNGSADQSETPFNLRQSHPTYNITITQITVGVTVADLEFHAIFDTGTSFTYLNDPAYTQITESFNSLATDDRHTNESELPFEYCYDLRSNQKSYQYPQINLTMKGGNQYSVIDPIVETSTTGGGRVYCLGVVKSGDVNIIGQNFMTGYTVVFDREKLVLGWKESNCYDERETATLPVKPSNTPAVSPSSNVSPEATAGAAGNKTVISQAAPPATNHSPSSTHLRMHPYLLFFLQFFSFFIHSFMFTHPRYHMY